VKAAVALRCDAPDARRYRRRVSADARSLLKLLRADYFELSLLLTTDPPIRELNRIFRGKDHATDVLSFPQLEASFVERSEHPAHRQTFRPALGDVVISIDTARRQADQLGVTTESRLRSLLIHGVLHLLGYDHERSGAEARRMFARQRQLAAALEPVQAKARSEKRIPAGEPKPRSAPAPSEAGEK
jgi:rRNA maturation RNase YbeY